MASGATSWLVPFDLKRRAVTGTPIPVLSGVYSSGRINSHYYTFSSSGTLVYVAGESGNRLAWVDRDGIPTPVETSEGTYRWPRISPDGSQVAVTVASRGTGNTSVWVGQSELDRLRPLTRLLRVGGVWDPGGSALVLVDPVGIQRQDVGTSTAVLLHETGMTAIPRSWTPDGASLGRTGRGYLGFDRGWRGITNSEYRRSPRGANQTFCN